MTDSVRDLKQEVRRARASIAWQWATNPASAQYLSGKFGGEPEAMTEATVRAEFGDEAADWWKIARDAHGRFLRAADQGRSDET